MANANAATFDGTNDYLTRGADLTGNSDSKIFTFSLWFKRGATGSQQEIYASGGARCVIQFTSGDKINVNADNVGGTLILDVDTSAITDTSSWHNVLGSFDLSDTGKRHLYLDDAADLTVNTYTNDTIDHTRGNHAIGALANGTTLFNGCLAEVWIDTSQYIDFSVESNRRKFISSDSKAVDLGTDGATPTGTAPIMYFANEFSTFQTNLGSGGGFTENGALADCTGPEEAVSTAAGNGALSASVSTISAGGTSQSAGDGSLVSDDSVIGGGPEVGFSGEIMDWDGSGDNVLWDTNDNVLWGPISGTIPGQGYSFSEGSNGLAAQAATVSGSGVATEADVLGGGTLSAQDAAVSGEGIQIYLGSGALSVGKSKMSGEGPPFIYLGNGALAAQAATIDGSGSRTDEAGMTEVGNVAGQKYAGRRRKRRVRARKPVFIEG